MTQETRFIIERFSPRRNKWVQWKEHFKTEQQAQDHVDLLNFQYRVQGLKFRYQTVSYDPAEAKLKADLHETLAQQEQVQEQLADLKHDPKKAQIKALTKEDKTLQKEAEALRKKLAAISHD